MGGGNFSGLRPLASQPAAIERIRDLVTDDFPPDGLLAPEAPLSALLGSKASAYSNEPEDTCVATYVRELVSLPSTAGQCDLCENVLLSAESVSESVSTQLPNV